MPGDVDWNLDEIHLEDYGLPDLPNSPTCPNLVKLFLQVPSLVVIPPDFFKHMRGLKVLDLSNTNIVSLPTSISSLPLLQEFFLRDCSALIELPSEIGMLSELKVFDIKGTELMFLPKGMGNLKNLEVLRISLSQYAKEYVKNSVNETVIPRMMISGLRKLKELCVLISVGPEPEWWEEEVKYLNNELCDLTNLETLGWYLPTTEVLQQFLLLERNHVPIYASLSNLMLTIGQHAQLTSCLPRGLENKFEQFKNCLKWINAEGSMDGVSKIIARAEALFLSRHWTIKMISNFNITNLKYCLLAECNEMETLVETDGLSEDVETGTKNGDENALELLQYLSIHHMNKLQSLWKGPIGKDSLSKLRILALHTCSQFTSIFTPTIVQNLSCLVELTVEDCPKVISVISGESHIYGPIFPSLEKFFLLDLPELVYIFDGQITLKNLRTMLVYSCEQFMGLSYMELPHIEKIEGETEWWKGFGYEKSQRNIPFVALKERRDLVEQLFDATNSLEHFHNTLLIEAVADASKAIKVDHRGSRRLPAVSASPMASDLAAKAKEAFIDDFFELAVDLYSQAILIDPHSPDCFSDRAQANIKLNNFTEAVADASKAIELDPSNPKAYLRKGTACFRLEEYQTAKATFEAGSKLAPGDTRFTDWIKKCDKCILEEFGELPTQSSDATPTNVAASSTTKDVEEVKNVFSEVIITPAKPKYRHEFYQTPDEIVVEIFAKGIPANSVFVSYGEQILSVAIDVPAEDPYIFQPRLFGKIVPTKCRYDVLSTKVEIRLSKAETIHWTSLEFVNSSLVVRQSNVSTATQRPAYPSSKPTKDWDMLEAQVKREEKAALNKFFREIYKDADEDTRRAMSKSFVESNGTVLTTNWKEGGSKVVEGTPPDGVEMKKWEY